MSSIILPAVCPYGRQDSPWLQATPPPPPRREAFDASLLDGTPRAFEAGLRAAYGFQSGAQRRGRPDLAGLEEMVPEPAEDLVGAQVPLPLTSYAVTGSVCYQGRKRVKPSNDKDFTPAHPNCEPMINCHEA